MPATIVRTGTVLFFLVAVGALNEVRQRRPDSGCGCFGELSGTPIGLRTIARPGLLCASAVATLGLPPLRMPASSTEAELRQVDIVFAVYLQSRRPAIRAAVLDADTDEVLGPSGTRESVVI